MATDNVPQSWHNLRCYRSQAAIVALIERSPPARPATIDKRSNLIMPDSTPHPTSIELQSDTSWYTLEPLRTEGRDALQPVPGIRKITLREIEIHWQNAPDDITIRKADDLFERAAALADEYGPIAAKATLARATFDLEMENSTRPHKLSIRPPDRITVESRAEAGPILRWLAKCGFRRARLGRTIAPAVLTLAGGVLPADDQTGDQYPERVAAAGGLKG